MKPAPLSPNDLLIQHWRLLLYRGFRSAALYMVDPEDVIAQSAIQILIFGEKYDPAKGKSTTWVHNIVWRVAARLAEKRNLHNRHMPTVYFGDFDRSESVTVASRIRTPLEILIEREEREQDIKLIQERLARLDHSRDLDIVTPSIRLPTG